VQDHWLGKGKERESERERERKRKRKQSGGVRDKEQTTGKWWKGRTIERERSEALQTYKDRSVGKCETLHPCVWISRDNGYRKSLTTTISSSPP